MSTRIASWLAWAVCALSLALTALSFLLIALILWLRPETAQKGEQAE